MKKTDKRGISAIVATVLIIGITVGVIAIVGNFIIGMVTENLASGDACSKASLEVRIVPEFTCITDVNNGNYTINVQVSRGTVGLEGLRIIPRYQGSDVQSMAFNESDVPDEGLTKVLTYNITSDAEEVSIIPVIAVGDSKTECSASTPVNLKAC